MIKARSAYWSSGHQAAVRLCEGQVPSPCQEHGQLDDAVCAKQFADGTASADARVAGMDASEIGLGDADGDEMPSLRLKNGSFVTMSDGSS